MSEAIKQINEQARQRRASALAAKLRRQAAESDEQAGVYGQLAEVCTRIVSTGSQTERGVAMCERERLLENALDLMRDRNHLNDLANALDAGRISYDEAREQM